MPGLESDVRAEIIEELSSHLESVQTGASSLPALGHVFRDPQSEKDVVKHCRAVLNLVARRRRSEQEIRDKLATRTEDPEIIEEVLARLDRAGVLDDHAFAEQWIAERRALKKLGTAALRSELEAKGVDEGVINAALHEAEDEGETQRCRELAREYIQKERAGRGAGRGSHGGRGAILRRVGAKLARRGYSHNLILYVVNRELDAAGVTWN